ncbi:hypothetical protein [Planctomicrobium sp. SH527]|uniref:hypothetical protein n=1 Tax=Planctomicrobium sp. SH527 TaxID=3448123 RepID=UPI003F5B46C6
MQLLNAYSHCTAIARNATLAIVVILAALTHSCSQKTIEEQEIHNSSQATVFLRNLHVDSSFTITVNKKGGILLSGSARVPNSISPSEHGVVKVIYKEDGKSNKHDVNIELRISCEHSFKRDILISAFRSLDDPRTSFLGRDFDDGGVIFNRSCPSSGSSREFHVTTGDNKLESPIKCIEIRIPLSQEMAEGIIKIESIAIE